MAIALAMELPTSRLEQWAPLADLDFILAHQVLADKPYADFFRHRPANRELILDNSLHELGHPLPLEDLGRAAHLCRADFIITPDRVGDEEFNSEQFVKARKFFGRQYRLAVVMTGSKSSTIQDRENFLLKVSDAAMLCCTFKEPLRLAWYLASDLSANWNRVHLLGVDNLQELLSWTAVAHQTSHVKFSADTGKAFKRAMQGELLSELSDWRKSSLHSKDLLNVSSDLITPDVETLFLKNVKTLRDALEMK